MKRTKTKATSKRSGNLTGLQTSDVKLEQQHIAVLHHIFLAFQPKLARVARTRFAAERDVIVISDGLGTDEALLEIGMDHARSARSLGALGDGPGARFLRPHREVGDEVQQLVPGADQPVEAGFLKLQRFEKIRALGA